MEKKTEKIYDFGEKKVETINDIDCPVWQTPKYLEAKKKVIETLESEKYKDILNESDFWILVNTYANKTKVMYSGLIISHNGCLKINDTLENKVNPNNFIINQNGYNNSLVIQYIDDEVCEFGEVSPKNCKNDYPYAMAYKRCFDRVVLKKCKLAYSGIYSDSEADEFKEPINEPNVETSLEKEDKKKEKQTADNNIYIKIKKLMAEKKVLANEVSEHFDKNSADMTQEELEEVVKWLEEK